MQKGDRYIQVLFLLIVSLLLSVQGLAQRYPFYNLNVENGLIQSQATSLAQDKYGHLWIGTIGGLSRYDGTSFTNYSVRNGMLTNRINALAADKKGNIWIGSNSGLSCYNGKVFKHFMLHSPNRLTPGIVSSIQISENGKVWCIADGIVYSIQNGKSSALDFSNKYRATTAIAPDNNDLWLASYNRLYHYHNKTWDSMDCKNIHSITQPTILRLYQDKQHKLWVLTTNGLYEIEQNALVIHKINNAALNSLPPLIGMTEDNDHTYWLCTSAGVIRMTDTSLQYYNKHNGLSDNTYYDALTDAEGNVWLASDGKGVYRFSGSHFTCLDESTGLPSAQAMSIVGNKAGTIYIGTYDAGLYAYDKGKIRPIPFPGTQPIRITSLIMRKGELWIGTRGQGLWKYDGNSVKNYPAKHYGFSSNLITALFNTDDDRLFIGFPGSMSIYENNTFHKILVARQSVQDFLSLAKDSILISTDEGLFLYRDTISKFITNTTADSNAVQCTTLQGENLWIGTTDNGLICYNLKTRKSFSINKSNGLHSDFIYNLVNDADGGIWAGTGFGIHKVRMVNDKMLITFYGKEQGVSSMESNHNAGFKMQDGSIWFGTTNGALHYQPAASTHSSAPISIVLQSVKLFGENISDSTYYDSVENWYKVPYNLRLPYRKNNITFTFHAISLSGEDEIQYRYKVEGLDAPWSDWSTINSVNYSSLPPGKYVLRVQCSSDDEKSTKELSYPFEIITPFHKTSWFRLIILIFCIQIGVFLQYLTNKRKQNRLNLLEQLRREEQNKVRERTAEDFHDEVGNKLTRINILSDVLKSKIKHISPDAIRIIAQIQDNTQQIYGGTRDILWSLKPSNDNLYEILHRVRDFGGELFQDIEIDFVFIGSDDAWKNYKLPLDISRNLIMIFKEALNNCLKYAHATKVTLEVQLLPNDTLRMVLNDNGKGFDMTNTKRGHGIDNMNVRAKRINGTLSMVSSINQGTTITLIFKIPSTRG